MTDNLRTRIAAVLYAMDCDDYDIQAGEELDPSVFWAIREGAERRADAVIRELKQEWRADFGYDGYEKCETRDHAQDSVDDFNAALGDDIRDGEQAVVMHRYVTEWTENESDD